jgi:hypothetical protein
VTHPIRARLAEGSKLLKSVAASKDLAPEKAAGLKELAVDIDAVLAPRGHLMLRESGQRKAGVNSAGTSPLSLTVTRSLKDALKQAEAEFASPLATLAEEGFRAALDGWLPPETVKTLSRSAQEKAARQSERTVLQLQVDDALRKQVERAIPALTERAGYRVTLSSIAISWMADQLGVQRPGEGTQPLLLQFIPRAWCDHWETVAAERGVTLQAVMEDGIRALRDGSWEFPKPVRSAKGSGISRDDQVRKFMVRVDAELLEFLEEQAPVLAEKHDRKVFPGTIGLAILKDRLGLPDGV